MDEVDDSGLWSTKDPFPNNPQNLSCGLLPFVRTECPFFNPDQSPYNGLEGLPQISFLLI